MRLPLLKFAVLASIFAAPLIARADNFTFTSQDGTTTFSIPGTPVVDDHNGYFGVENVTFSGYNAGVGTAYFNNEGDFAFSVSAFPGGFGSATDPMWSGTSAAPTFIAGTYDLEYESHWTGSHNGPDTLATLSIVNPAATPEPSSLILLGTGLVGLAGAARRRMSK